MKCVNCDANEADGGLYCATCRKGDDPEREADLDARFGKKRPCRRCGEWFRDQDVKKRENYCGGCRRFG